MRKKYLSALLFGALLFASAGTFTSCKDYDEDINNLQNQITSNKDAIAALQKLVGEGKWVASISPIENGFTVTMSDGSTQNITGINGEDGKPGTVISLDPTTNNWIIDGVDTGICAKGEKGDKGDQGEQGPAGEAGQDGAQGVQGEAGQNAPSPQIDPETGNWIVYAWDEATGDYKATVTDVYAQATKVFVVEKEGFIELNVDGVAYLLPTTSDAFMVQALTEAVKVSYEAAEWNPTTTNVNYQKLAKAFPEITKIEKETLLKQGGKLPVIITPSTVELTNDMKFSLQNVKGEIAEATLSNPVKGLPELIWHGPILESRSNTNDCYWTLDVEPGKNKQGKYVDLKEKHALVVEKDNGTVVKTTFAYTVETIANADVDVYLTNSNLKYAESIDLLASIDDEDPAFTIDHGYGKYYLFEVTDPATIERYQLSFEGSVLKIGNMPAGLNNIDVPVKVTVLGLNGTTDVATANLKIARDIEAEGNLADKDVVLSTTSNTQTVLWNISDFKFSAVQKEAFVNAMKTMKLSYYDDEQAQDVQFPTVFTVVCYKSDGKTVTTDYTQAEKFGITISRQALTPREYKVRLDAIQGTNSTILAAEATMNVANPDVDSMFRLASAYVEDDVLQITGDYTTAPGYIIYNLAEGIVVPSYATISDYKDLDYAAWKESMGSSTDMGAIDWIQGGKLVVNKYDKNAEANKKQLYVERNIRATYSLFGNPENTVNFDFEVVVKSAVYSEDPTKVITADATKLTTKFGATEALDITGGLKAVYAEGKKKGQEYSLFNGVKADPITYYDQPKTSGTYVVNSANVPVEIDKEDLIAFGMTAADYVNLPSNKKFYVQTNEQPYGNSTLVSWSTIYAGRTGQYKALFEKYKGLIAFVTDSDNTKLTYRADEIDNTTFAWADKSEAEKYVDINASDLANGKVVAKKLDDIKETLVEGKATVNIKLTVVDKWGMTMVRTFPITLTAK